MIVLIIVGMALVTMIPRLLPVFIVDQINFTPWINQCLNAIPYAALGALIFPGILSVYPDQPKIGIFGGIIAIILSLFGLNIIFVVLGAIATVYFLAL